MAKDCATGNLRIRLPLGGNPKLASAPFENASNERDVSSCTTALSNAKDPHVCSCCTRGIHSKTRYSHTTSTAAPLPTRLTFTLSLGDIDSASAGEFVLMKCVSWPCCRTPYQYFTVTSTNPRELLHYRVEHVHRDTSPELG